MFKVFYDRGTLDIISVIPHDNANPPEYSHLGTVFIMSDSDLDQKPLDDNDLSLGTAMAFPFGDIARMRKIAVLTVEQHTKEKQASGFTFAGHTFSTTQEAKINIMGKILELNITTASSTVYPDINGVPVTLTNTEMMILGVQVGQYMQQVFTTGATVKYQISNAASNALIISLVNSYLATQ